MLAEVGYDRLTMDAVATAAKASKATLYRRWNGKVALVIDALRRGQAVTRALPDTGILRGRPARRVLRHRRAHRRHAAATFASVHHRARPRRGVRRGVPRRASSAPRWPRTRAIFERAQARGEIRPDVDLDLLAPALAGIVLHRMLRPRRATHRRTHRRGVIDQIILPAARPLPDPRHEAPT